MACDAGNPANVVKGFFQFLGDPIGTILKAIAEAVMSAAIDIFGDLVLSVPTLSPDPSAYEDISGQTQWIVVYTAIASMLFAAIRMAIERRGEAGTTALKGLLRVVLVAGGATTVVGGLASLSDKYSDFLFKTGADKTLQHVGCSGGGSLQAFLLLILAFLLLIAAIVQTILMYVRLGIMILLLGTLPVAAAASMTGWGGSWWRKHIGWMTAWLLYKPAAALVIYAGAAMISDGQSQNGAEQEKIAGIGVLLLSALALPALLKLVAPATAALGGGMGAGQVLAAAGGLATGAVGAVGAAKAGGLVAGGGGAPTGAAGGGGSAGGGAGGSGSSGGGRVTGTGGAGGDSQLSRRGAESGGDGGGGTSPQLNPGGSGSGMASANVATSALMHASRLIESSVEGADGELGHN
ncbi:hypothetical protein [Streptomyces sp. NBC_01497]|uniref:hypothetical protein n=1 Tax=Streptomyces sp. NBC_01497 TaxID=2903885 RepID=UPI002E2EF627|nr:hypothetical protein [Streptomyces sp. NBC_01497]